MAWEVQTMWECLDIHEAEKGQANEVLSDLEPTMERTSDLIVNSDLIQTWLGENSLWDWDYDKSLVADAVANIQKRDHSMAKWLLSQVLPGYESEAELDAIYQNLRQLVTNDMEVASYGDAYRIMLDTRTEKKSRIFQSYQDFQDCIADVNNSL